MGRSELIFDAQIWWTKRRYVLNYYIFIATPTALTIMETSITFNNESSAVTDKVFLYTDGTNLRIWVQNLQKECVSTLTGFSMSDLLFIQVSMKYTNPMTATFSIKNYNQLLYEEVTCADQSTIPTGSGAQEFSGVQTTVGAYFRGNLMHMDLTEYYYTDALMLTSKLEDINCPCSLWIIEGFWALSEGFISIDLTKPLSTKDSAPSLNYPLAAADRIGTCLITRSHGLLLSSGWEAAISSYTSDYQLVTGSFISLVRILSEPDEFG
jgi:hypothetical protein